MVVLGGGRFLMSEAPLYLESRNTRPSLPSRSSAHPGVAEKRFFIDNLLVRIHFIIEMIW